MQRAIRQDKYTTKLNLFWIGLGLFLFGYAQPDIILISTMGNVMIRITMLGGLIIYFTLFSTLAPKEIDRTRWGKTLIVALLLWHLYMLIRSDFNDLTNYTFYFDPYSFSLYLFALVLLVPVLPLMRSYFTVNRWLMLMAFPLGIVAMLYYTGYGAIQYIFEGFIFGASLIVLTNKYHSKQWVYLAFATLLFGLFVAAVTARRNLIVTDFLYLCGGLYLMFFQGEKFSRSTKVFALMSIMCLGLLGAGFFIMNNNGVFATLVERAGENTRDYVVFYFFWDMLQSPLDMIIGRGSEGVYECFGVQTNNKDNVRQVIENGYLQLMLKGGIIYIGIYLSLFVAAISKAWKGQNQMCQAAIIVLLIQLVDMLFFGLHAVSLKTYMIWMCISFCLSPSLTAKNDRELQDALTEKRQKLPKWE